MADPLVTYSARFSTFERAQERLAMSTAAIDATSRRYDKALDRVAGAPVPKALPTRGQLADKFS
jgi:hypothetical protein